MKKFIKSNYCPVDEEPDPRPPVPPLPNPPNPPIPNP